MKVNYYLIEFEKFTGSKAAKYPIQLEAPLGAEADVIWDYEFGEVSHLISEYNISVISTESRFEVRPARELDQLSYEIHTERELLLMIQGIKPLSVFSKYSWEEFDPYGGQRFEELHAEFGIQKHVQLEPNGLMRIFFALPGEEWRIKAYLDMIEDMYSNGYTPTMERTEGRLLGYTEEQCDEFMARFRAKWQG